MPTEIAKTTGTATAIAVLTAVPMLILFEPACGLIAFASAFAAACTALSLRGHSFG